MLYIFWILHQTTTLYLLYIYSLSCIFFESYIKPQLSRNTGNTTRSSISFESYIKPQPTCQRIRMGTVVYLLNPTSNHNLARSCRKSNVLYIFWILHQTTTQPPYWKDLFVVYLLNPTSNHNASFSLTLDSALYIFWILHQTTTFWRFPWFEKMLYIFWILHQTTTWAMPWYISMSCISFESYIKPQLLSWVVDAYKVVYLLNPTSNHNIFGTHYAQAAVVYLLNPTSNHNSTWITSFSMLLYIFWILHQTTTLPSLVNALSRCISFESYIKPQPTDKCH